MSLYGTCKPFLVGLGIVEVPLGDVGPLQADLSDCSLGHPPVGLVQDSHLDRSLGQTHSAWLVWPVLGQGVGGHLVGGFGHCVCLHRRMSVTYQRQTSIPRRTGWNLDECGAFGCHIEGEAILLHRSNASCHSLVVRA
jgi:hypothetical protein